MDYRNFSQLNKEINLTSIKNYTILTLGMYLMIYYLHNLLYSGGRETSMSNTTRIRKNESLESALRRFKRDVSRSGTLSEYRKREYYEKPSVRRKKKSEAARKRKF